MAAKRRGDRMENPNKTSEGFGPRLAGLRRAAGLTQQQLAERLYVTRQAVSRWESGVSHS